MLLQHIPEEISREVDDVLHALGDTSGMPAVLLTAVDDTTWYPRAGVDRAATAGHTFSERSIHQTYCEFVCKAAAPLVIADARHDARFREHPAHRDEGICSYVGVPFSVPGGPVLGTLCAYDRAPHIGLEHVVPHFELLGRLLGHELQLADVARSSLAALQRETENAVSRERFLASVAHDLRTPLAAIQMSAQLILRQPNIADRVGHSAGRVLAATRRMTRLIEDLLDFARGRLGSGIPILVRELSDIRAFFGSIFEETAAAYPGRTVRWHVELDAPVQASWDVDRISQCVGNLLGNACEHGSRGEPVMARVSEAAGEIVIEIVNCGELPPSRNTALFDPFHAGPGRRGLGLGLFIAERIARAHNGHVHLRSADGETRTTLILPCRAPAQRYDASA